MLAVAFFGAGPGTDCLAWVLRYALAFQSSPCCLDVGTWQNSRESAAMTDCPFLGDKLHSSGEAHVMNFAILGKY